MIPILDLESHSVAGRGMGRSGYYKQHQVKYLGTMRLLDSTNVMSLISGRVLSRTQAFSLQVQSCYMLPSWMFPLSTKVKMIVFNLELAGCTVFVFVFFSLNCMISCTIKSSK